jgi:hypothetical protein
VSRHAQVHRSFAVIGNHLDLGAMPFAFKLLVTGVQRYANASASAPVVALRPPRHCCRILGPLRHPVRNIWVVQFGMIACLGVIPLTLIAGPIRGTPGRLAAASHPVWNGPSEVV